MKIYAVIVTYGDRFHLLKQVIDAALNEGVCKVIVVDNNSQPESRNKLIEYERLLNGKIKVLYLDDNYGSARGFKRGLEVAYNESECEFIWLLDDDNKPMEGALKILLDFWSSLEIQNKEEKIALRSYRFKFEPLMEEAIMNRNKSEFALVLKNSFLGFHIKEIHKKIYRYLKRQFKSKNNIVEQENDKKFGIVPIAPYGGFFINKNIINKIDYPNEDFYLYIDDYEWSFRITQMGGGIYLLLDSKIDDLELSWSVPKSTKQSSFSIISKGNPFRVYYHVRNMVFFEINNLVDNKLVYWINVSVCLLLICFSSMKNIKVIIKGVKDGYKGKLGKAEILE